MHDTQTADALTLGEDEQRELVDVPLRRADLNTRIMTVRVHDGVSRWVPEGPDAAGVPTTYGPLDKMDVIPGVLAVPTVDEDIDKMNLAKKFAFRALRALPLTDDADAWPSPDAAATVIKSHFEPILPPAPVVWSDVTSDRALSLLAFQGLAAHRLEPLEADADGAAYVVDVSWMHAFAVRPGLEPYGASAYFAADRSPLRIHTMHDDQTLRPGDESWDDAKWRWRSTLFAASA